MKSKELLKLILPLWLFIYGCSENNYEQFVPGSKQKFEFQYTDFEGKVKHSEFILSIPLNYNTENKYPMLVILSGDSLSADEITNIWKPAADSLGVILLTPVSLKFDSTGVVWSEDSDIMILSGMDAAAKKSNLDFSQLYVAGFYNGGTLAYELGFKYPQIFKGVSAVSSKLPSYYKTESLEFLKGKKFYITAGEFETDVKNDADEALKLMIKNAILTQHVIYFDVYKGLPEDYRPEIKKIIEYFFNKEK